MTHSRMLDFPGNTIRLERDVADMAENHAGLAEFALEAAYAFSDNLCIPLSIEMVTSYWEDEFDLPITSPPRPSEVRMLRCEIMPPEVEMRPTWLGEEVRIVDSIDLATASQFAREFLAAGPGDAAGMTIGWEEMQVNSTMVRLPYGYADTGIVPVEVPNGIVDHPTERIEEADWAYGPMGVSMLHAPFEYRIHRASERLRFDISVYWTTWTKGEAGYSDFETGVETLLNNGWLRA